MSGPVDARYRPIRDYAAIGDCHGSALVSRQGSVDWCCFKRFDADPVCCRILDGEKGGFLAVRPTGEFTTRRCYVYDTNVLTTSFTTPGGTLTVTDFMPAGRRPGAGTHDYVSLNAPGWLVRIIEGNQGTVELDITYRPSRDYARCSPQLVIGPNVVAVENGPCLYHDLPHVEISAGLARSAISVAAGDRQTLVITPSATPGVSPVDQAGRLAATTITFWSEWIAYCRYRGRYGRAVRRSALALKMLTYAPTGAIAAAFTTSLPEEIGGGRNWDYRYCWLRDSTFTLYAFSALGFSGEARKFTEFLVRACAESNPDLQIMYGIGAETDLKEETLDHLEGYCSSRPVRRGNGAFRQRQIDIYGEVLDSALLYQMLGGRFESNARGMLEDLADFAAAHWHEPDQGIWEMRGPPRHHTYSKGMCWVALDRAIRLFGSRPDWESARRQILNDIVSRAVHPTSGGLAPAYGQGGADAALLLLPLVALPIDRQVLEATIDVVERELRDGPFVFRYRGDDGLQGSEGAFFICSFWLVDALLFNRRYEEARLLFEQLLASANDVGLYSEEIDPQSGMFLGNFPQAFTHLALIGAAVHLELYEKGGIEALAGSHADRARRQVTATFGWRAIWAALQASRRVGRILPSKRSVLEDGLSERRP